MEQEYAVTPHQFDILKVVQKISKQDARPYAFVGEVATEMSKPEASIRTTVYSLLKRGYLKRPLRGGYILSEKGRELINSGISFS